MLVPLSTATQYLPFSAIVYQVRQSIPQIRADLRTLLSQYRQAKIQAAWCHKLGLYDKWSEQMAAAKHYKLQVKLHAEYLHAGIYGCTQEEMTIARRSPTTMGRSTTSLYLVD